MTEDLDPRYLALETAPALQAVDTILQAQVAAVQAVQAIGSDLARAAEAITARLRRGGRLIYLGAGTSGRLAALDAAELPPTFGWPPARAVALMAGGAGAFQTAVEGAEDDTRAPVEALDDLGLTAHDAVIGIAASGRTPFVRAGLDHARHRGALTVAVVNAPGPVQAEIILLAATGPEVVAGSTRMKAGTAQKVILNTLSTAVMLQLGLVHRGRMVEMRPTNAKLRTRAIGIVADLTGADAAQAEATLDLAQGAIPVAVVMLRLGLDRAGAMQRLAAHGTLAAALGQT
jgi:N-acetylmuramic acid 6-phosphate etherase